MFRRFKEMTLFNKSCLRGGSVLLVAAIAACGYTPLSTMNALRAVDPLTTPVKDMRVMVALPAEFLPQKGTVSMQTRLGATDTLPAQTYEIRLQQIPKGAVEMRVDQGPPTYAYRIHPDDISQFEALRTVDGAGNREGSLSVKASACRMTPEIPHEARVTIYLKTAELQDYVMLVRNADILDGVTPEDIAVEIPICTASNSVMPSIK